MIKIKKRLKHFLKTYVLYSVSVYILLIPFQMWVECIGLSLLIGFLFSLGNEIITQLRKLNGEKFPNIEDDKDDKIKMIKS